MDKPYFCRCPKCGENVRLSTMEVTHRPSVLSQLFLLVFGGLIVFLIGSLEHKERRVVCLRCGHSFDRPGLPTSGVTWAGYCIWWALILGVVLGVFAGGYSTWLEGTRLWTYIGPVSEFIAAHPTAFAVGLVFVAFALILIGFGMVTIGTRRQHAKLREQYRLGWPDAPGAEIEHAQRADSNPA